MPQLVNQRCALCQERIEAEYEGGFCSLCAAPIHHHCKNPEAADPGKCLGCGSDTTDKAAVQERLQQHQEAAVERLRQKVLYGDAEWVESRRNAKGDIRNGVLLLAFGLFVAGISLLATESRSGIFLSTPFLYGIVLLSRGLSHLWSS